MIEENGDKVDDSDKEVLKKEVEELKSLIAKEDFDEKEVEDKTDSLTKKMQDVSKKMYEKAAKETPKQEDKKEDVQEGEVVE